MIAVLCEKPSVGRDIARVLQAKKAGNGCLSNEQYVVTWAFGHLTELANPDEIDPSWKRWSMATLPMLPETIPVKVTKDGQAQYNVICRIFADARVERIICATDAGREGELIFRRIYRLSGCQKPFDRLWISSMTDQAIREGFERLAPGTQYDPLYASAQCRAEADWLVGMNGSRAFTLRYDALLSVGRVQTPTLSLLVQRRKEIEAFVPEEYHEVQADFGSYKGLYTNKGSTRLPTREEAKAVVQAVKGKEGRVFSVEREEKCQPPPLLYDLTTLQREANARYGLTAQATLNAAQNLYEKYKLLTYPRTDSRHLPLDQRPVVEKLLKTLPPVLKTLLPTPLREPGNRVFDNDKITDHHAILPTGKTPPASLPQAEANVFDLVQRRLAAVFMPDYRYAQTTVLTRVGTQKEYDFISKGKTVLDKGWQAVSEPAGKAKEEETPLPPLAVGETHTVQSVKTLPKKTKPPAQYTENTLLDAMEHAGRFVADEALRAQLKERGLGTPATRAAIIERLLAVGYATREKKALVATDKGMRLVEAVPWQLSSPETTGRWEKGLKDIERGKLEPERFMDSIRRYSAFLIDAANQAPNIAFPAETRNSAPAKPKKSAPKPEKAKEPPK